MKFIFLSLFVTFIGFFYSNLSAQNNAKSGDYYYKVSTYDRAIKAYKRELRKKNNDSQILYKIVDSYLNSNLNRAEALPFVKQLVEKDRSPETVYLHAKVLFYAYKFPEAISEFEWVKMHVTHEDELYRQSGIYIQWILNANAYMVSPVDVTFINLGKSINTNKSELNPFVSVNDDNLVYSSNKRYLSKIGANCYNVCKSNRLKNTWQKAKTLNYYVNSGYDEIVGGYAKDADRLFVFHNREGNEKIAYASPAGKMKYSLLEDFGYPIDRKGGEFGIWSSESSDTLIFAGENDKGNTDLFYSLKLPDGSYGEARPMSGYINTSYDENFPVLCNGGKRLYFSSNGEFSMGGFDLFYSDWDEETKEWRRPVNLGYPVNDVYDNYSISKPRGKRYAYVSALKDGGYGERDIYKVLFKEEEPNSLILRCNTFLDTDSGKVLPPFVIRAELRDSVDNKLVGSYRVSGDSARFVMAIMPGKYRLIFKNGVKDLYSLYYEVPEMWYSNEAFNQEFIIPYKNEEE
ncbi:tetratricopeptide repeat protein [Plebeiibacterium marinum]|uniref:Uncharacterized protein n=1 Tax=Plebeiibacterium marinum TaxID=2992111 RepID=A0AAE3MBR2_9BACT|nr:hypothetical protein [Plebeiobacterium marinum]MCW3804948.1 hypothetical protein [Plebeiobacterium marinum]